MQRYITHAEIQSLSYLLYSPTVHAITCELSADLKTALASLEGQRRYYVKTNSTKEFCLADSCSFIPLFQLTDHKEKKPENKAPYHKFLKNCRGT